MEEASCSIEGREEERAKARSLKIKEDVRTGQLYLTELHCMKCSTFIMSGVFGSS